MRGIEGVVKDCTQLVITADVHSRDILYDRHITPSNYRRVKKENLLFLSSIVRYGRHCQFEFGLFIM